MAAVEFVESAFRHGFLKEDFFSLLAGNYLKVRSQRGLDDIFELLGRTSTGSYLHVAYRVLTDGRLRVFHMRRMSEKERRRFRRMKR